MTCNLFVANVKPPQARHTRLYALFFFPYQITPKPEIPCTNQYVPSPIKFL